MLPQLIVPVHVDRWRYRGELELKNFFVLGYAGSRWQLRIAPMRCLEFLLPQMEQLLADNKEAKCGDGLINPKQMSFNFCTQPESIRDILRCAFTTPYADHRLDQFWGAEVYLANRSLRFTIASLLRYNGTIH